MLQFIVGLDNDLKWRQFVLHQLNYSEARVLFFHLLYGAKFNSTVAIVIIIMNNTFVYKIFHFENERRILSVRHATPDSGNIGKRTL